MQRVLTPSRPSWSLSLSGSGSGSGERRSPVEIVANMGTYVTRTQAAEFSGLRGGPFGRWADGVTAMRADCVTFADYWRMHNERVLSQPPGPGPLWAVLGDSTAQGLGAPGPESGYVGQVLEELRQRSELPWQVLNLSASGALMRDVLNDQLPRVPASADLVTCGIGVNDVLFASPGRLFSDMRALLAALPDQAVVLDLPLPERWGGLFGRSTRPYVARINRTLHEVAASRGLPVAEISANFGPPWSGKLASDCFHPSEDGYRDWTRAVLAVI
ncbi:MAG TPA: GDSL-type esterase/lipase family protein [Streptosporangiaceae bacterium]|nr:GDSL-type esterase/lipase family protein [Streptosporangiaceae bacterium]